MKILVIGIIAAAILLIRYLVSTIVYKGADAIENAFVERKNKKHPPTSENLKDRFYRK